ncbi:MAG: hypothetical protein U0414_43325 [Polyangiaceae bacterium]
MSWCAVFVALATASSMSCDDGAGTGGAGPGTSTASGSQTSTSASNATTSSGTTESGSSGVTAAPHLGAHGLAFYGYASLGAGSRRTAPPLVSVTTHHGEMYLSPSKRALLVCDEPWLALVVLARRGTRGRRAALAA